MQRRRPFLVLVVALVALGIVAVVVALLALPADARTRPNPYPLERPSSSVLRCVVLETYARGTLRGCADGTVTFTLRAAR